MRHSDFRHAFVLASALVVAACGAGPAQVSNSRTGAYEAALTPFENGFAVAWYDTRDGNGEIYMRLLDDNGRPVSPERRLTNSPDDSFEASIDRLGEMIAVAWYEQTATGQQMAKLGVWTRDGANRWVHTFAPDTRNPVVRGTSSAVLCAWVQADADGGEAVFAAWWDTDGRPKAAPIRLGRASKTTWNLNASIDERGIGWVVFDTESSTRASEVYVARVDGSATNAVRLTKDDGAPSKYPDLALGAGGRAALSWQEERDGNVEVYLITGKLSDLTGEIDGRSRREPARRITETATWSLVPAIRPRASGFAIAWNEYQPASVEVHIGTSHIFFHALP